MVKKIIGKKQTPAPEIREEITNRARRVADAAVSICSQLQNVRDVVGYAFSPAGGIFEIIREWHAVVDNMNEFDKQRGEYCEQVTDLIDMLRRSKTVSGKVLYKKALKITNREE